MRIQIPSLRAQLLLWLLIPVVTLGILSSFITYVTAIEFANNAYDDALADSARALASRMHYIKGKTIEIDLPEAAKAILEYDNEDKFFYQVISPKGRLVAGENLFLNVKPTDRKLLFWNARIHGREVRVATLKVPISMDHPTVLVTIHVAETYAGRNNLRLEIFSNVVLTQLLFILLSAGSVWLGVTQGLIPLEKIREAISRRSPRELHPLDEMPVPAEVKPLVHAINDLMKRLEEDLAVQRRFVSNAAHQLRTPLAGLKTQADLAFRAESVEERAHALQQMRVSVNRTIHLANQLLSLARTEPGIIDFQKFQPLDLSELTRKITREFVPQALQKGIDIGYEGGKQSVMIHGDPLSIREMVSNLLENAIRYCRPGDQVTVSVLPVGEPSVQNVELRVEDSGPGIPVAERERVFERFYRILGNKEDGSGLGLAIVREISEAHQATVRLLDTKNGSGVTVLVEFPAMLPT